MIINVGEELLNVDGLIDKLKEKGIEITRSGVYYWILKGVIPEEYIVLKKKRG